MGSAATALTAPEPPSFASRPVKGRRRAQSRLTDHLRPAPLAVGALRQGLATVVPHLDAPPHQGPRPNPWDSATDQRMARRTRTHSLFMMMAEHEPTDHAYQQARGQLVELHLPLVEHLARRFRDRGEPLDDLVQVGTIGLIKSVDRFDPERGVEFSTYATPTIIGEIKRHFRDKGWSVRVPRRLQEMRQNISVATEELSQRLGRSPTVAELAEQIGCSQEDVLEGLESANAYSTVSLDAGPDSDDTASMLDVLGAEDDALDGVEHRESLRPLLAALPPRERTILVLRFFRGMTQSQIAAHLGISQMHVSRLLARTLTQLREGLLVEE